MMIILNSIEIEQVSGGNFGLIVSVAGMVGGLLGGVVGVYIGSKCQSLVDNIHIDGISKQSQFFENQVNILNKELHTVLTHINPSPVSVAKI